MNNIKVVDLAEPQRPIPNPVITFSQAFSHYRELSSIPPLHWVDMYVYNCYYIDQIIWTAEILDEIKKAGFETPTPIQVNLYVCAPIMCPDMFHYCGQWWFCLYLYVCSIYCWCMLLVAKSYPIGDLPGLPSSTLVQVRYGSDRYGPIELLAFC